MPTYEYRCPDGHQFELFQRMSEEPRASCPECGKEAERVISGGAGFLFKGDGFYITDHRSESYKKEASKESAPEVPATGGGKESKADKPSPAKKADKAGPTPSKDP